MTPHQITARAYFVRGKQNRFLGCAMLCIAALGMMVRNIEIATANISNVTPFCGLLQDGKPSNLVFWPVPQNCSI